MMPIRHLLRPLLALVALALASPAAALRCDGRVVSRGDHAYEVEQRCGEPFWVERFGELVVIGEFGPQETRIERRVEAWYYNFGPDKLLRRLLFRDGRLEREDTLGYGYRTLGRECDLDALVTGLSTGEVVARCGAPAAQESRYVERILRDGLGNARQRLMRHEEWIYDRGGSRPRLLTFLDGRLDRIERLRD